MKYYKLDCTYDKDPDIEAVITIITGIVIPVATSIYQVIASQNRATIEDQRECLLYIYEMENSINQAEILLDIIENMVLTNNIDDLNIWPIGKNGIVLAQDQVNKYLRVVRELTAILERVDNAGIKSSILVEKESYKKGWSNDVKNLQRIIIKSYQEETYSSRIKCLRRALKIGKNILQGVKKEFDLQLVEE